MQHLPEKVWSLNRHKNNVKTRPSTLRSDKSYLCHFHSKFMDSLDWQRLLCNWNISCNMCSGDLSTLHWYGLFIISTFLSSVLKWNYRRLQMRANYISKGNLERNNRKKGLLLSSISAIWPAHLKPCGTINTIKHKTQ